MGDKAATDKEYSLASDSGVATSTNTTLAEPASSPPETATRAGESQGARAFDEISKGVLGLSSSSQTESASADAEDGKWTPSVSLSNTQQSPQDVSLSTDSTTTVGADQESSSLLKEPTPPPGAWKDQVPTLDSYQSTQASPTLSQTIKDSEGRTQSTFTVGPPDAVPYEEENVESTSEMIVQQPEMPLTGDAKKDRNKMINLETRLRDALAKIESLKKELETSRKEKEESERQLKEAKEKIERLKSEGEVASAAMKKQYEDEIADLKKKIADSEKEKSELKAEYCKQIKLLQDQLKDQEKSHYEEVIQLMGDKHKLELKVEKMNTNEEKLKRQLSEANLEAANLKYELGQRESTEKFEREMVILRSESAGALKKKEDALKKRDDIIEELRRQISQNSLKLDSSQDPGAENKDGAST